MIESLLLAVTRVGAMRGDARLSNATGFFFERNRRLFLVTNRHVVLGEKGDQRPDRLVIELHVDPDNAALTSELSLPLYRGEEALWRQAVDNAGTIDVVALEIGRSALPETPLFHAFTPVHLVAELDRVEVGTSVLIVGFPLGFHDTLHHLPVARQAIVASAFGMRFQGNGYFLTDARMHRGTSGAPVVARAATDDSGRRELTWLLLGVHSARLEVAERDAEQDERLDLNCAWYADVLLTLTDDPVPPAPPPA